MVALKILVSQVLNLKEVILNVSEMERFEGWMPDFLGKNLFFQLIKKRGLWIFVKNKGK